MFYRAYAIFTTSIYAIILGNELSLLVLMRLQLEDYLLTEHLLKNPDDIKKVFVDKIQFKKTINSSNDRKNHEDSWHFLSQKVHSFPEGLKTCFGNAYLFNSKKMKWEPTLQIKPIYKRIDNMDISQALSLILIYFCAIKKNLCDIKNLYINDEIDSYDVLHKKRTINNLKRK